MDGNESLAPCFLRFVFFKGGPELFWKLFCDLHYAIFTVSCCIRNSLKHLIKVGYQFKNEHKETKCVFLSEIEKNDVFHLKKSSTSKSYTAAMVGISLVEL